MRVDWSKLKESEVGIRIEEPEDLWHLSHFIKTGDIIGKREQRTRKEKEGGERKGKEKVVAFLQVTVEEIKYEKEHSRLRVAGIISGETGGVEKGHHTLSLAEKDLFTLSKFWTDKEKEHLKELERKKRYRIFVVLIDREGASFTLLNETGMSDLGELESELQGKQFMHQSGGERYKEEVIKTMEEKIDAVDSFVLAGPGFEKDAIYEKLSMSLRKKTVLENTSVTGRSGVSELLRRGVIAHVEKNDRISLETEAVERFLTALAKKGKVTYGMDHVLKAIEMGAVSEVLVLEGRESPELMEKIDKIGGKMLLIHRDNESGERLQHLSGVAAFLRFPIE